jgi:hypothetical protein
MSGWMRAVSSIVRGAMFPAAVLGIAASAPLVNTRFITLVDGRILTVAWWIAVPLGTAFAIMRSRKLATGAAIGVLSIVAFHASMVLMLDPYERTAAVWAVESWVSAFFAVAVPWALGMALGWQSIEGRQWRYDGGPEPPDA